MSNQQINIFPFGITNLQDITTNVLDIFKKLKIGNIVPPFCFEADASH